MWEASAQILTIIRRRLPSPLKYFNDARSKGHNMKIIDIGGGFPVPYDSQVPEFEKLGSLIDSECQRLFPPDVEIIAEPGRFIVATAATLLTEIIGKSRRDGKIFYYINDGVYHTFSGVITITGFPISPRSRTAKKKYALWSDRLVTVSIRYPSLFNFREIWKSAIIFLQIISAHTALPLLRILTVSTALK